MFGYALARPYDITSQKPAILDMQSNFCALNRRMLRQPALQSSYNVLSVDCGSVMYAVGDGDHTTVHTHLENQPCGEGPVADCMTGGSKFDSRVVRRGGRTLGHSRLPIQYRGLLPWG